MSASPPSMRRARAVAGSLVGALVAIGVVMSLGAGDGSIWRDLGLALLSGGIVGGALVAVETLLAGAADARSAATSLRLMLSTTTDLNGIDLSGQKLDGLYRPGRAFVAAELSNSDLSAAKLQFADLRFARLVGADLSQVRGSLQIDGPARFDSITEWPSGFSPPKSKVVEQAPISEMDLAEYLTYRQQRRSR